MRKFIVFIVLVVLLIVGMYYGLAFAKQRIKADLRISLPAVFTDNSLREKPVTISSESLFVPYWTLNSTLEQKQYDEYYYFGVVPGENGINTNEEGYVRLAAFLRAVPPEKSFLVIRMLDRQQNTAILESKEKQEKLIASAAALAKERGMKGVLLDLEHSVFPFESLVTQISSFISLFAGEVKKSDLAFYTALYGDVFYRPRPFDAKKIAEVSDKVVFMAYDFHKANGNPGPNFPLDGEETYGYSYEELVKDIQSIMPVEKAVITFGYFGYDWEVNNEDKSTASGDALSTNAITQKYLDCSSCVVLKDDTSEETKITFSQNGKKHIIWFEDPLSVKEKQNWLKKYGIGNFSYWAYSYF